MQRKLAGPLVLVLGKAAMSQNSIKSLNQDRDSLKQKPALAVIA